MERLVCSFVFIKVYRKFYILLLKKVIQREPPFLPLFKHTHTDRHTHTFVRCSNSVRRFCSRSRGFISLFNIYIKSLACSYFKTKIFPRGVTLRRIKSSSARTMSLSLSLFLSSSSLCLFTSSREKNRKARLSSRGTATPGVLRRRKAAVAQGAVHSFTPRGHRSFCRAF